MVRFQIPKAFLPGFEILLTLTPTERQSIGDFLRRVPIGTGPQTFVKIFAENIQIKDRNSSDIASTIYSLGSFKQTAEKFSEEEIIEGLISSFYIQTKRATNEEELPKFKLLFQELFDASTSLNNTFKAFQLLSEQDNVFRIGHIISDIRLLFKDDLKDRNRYGIVKHQLRVEAESDGTQSDYFFSLTRADLEKLKEQILRAIEKEDLIRNDYESSIAFISVTE